MRAWLSIAALFLVVAALGVWVYLAPPPAQVATLALSTLHASDVQRISFTHGEQSSDTAADAQRGAVVLERKAGGWRITAPFDARAEPFQVERLLGILDARAATRLPAQALAQYGLATPSGRLTLDEQTFSFGGFNQLTREQYVLTNDAVYAIPVSQRTTLPRDVDALIARALFAPDEYPVRFALSGFSMTLDEGRWRLAPDAKETTGDERNAWVNAWRSATAIRVMRPPKTRSVSSTVGITFKDGTELALGIVQREPELVLFRPDEGIEYSFLSEIGKRLLEPPARRE
jgi:Domain of unknown function (DUF4340)